MFDIFKKKPIYKLNEVFTSASSAKLTYVERIDLINALTKSIDVTGQQIVVYGHTGSGKTTLVENLLKKINKEPITINCMEDTTYESLLYSAFDSLKVYYTTSTSKTKENIKTNQIILDYILSKIQGGEISENKQKIIPYQLNAQNLAECFGMSQKIWVIDDFHKMKSEERVKFSQMIKVFVDMSNKYPGVKIIAIGAEGSARKVIEYDNELNARIAEINVPLMNDTELESIILKGEKLLNIKFEEILRINIISFSKSLASICHSLCYNICYEKSLKCTQKKTINITDFISFEKSINSFVSYNKDTYQRIIDKVLKNDEQNKIQNLLKVISNDKRDHLSFNEIYQLLKNIGINNKKIEIEALLKQLTQIEYLEILNYDENSGKYSFSNPFIKSFFHMFILSNNNKIDEKFISNFTSNILKKIKRNKINIVR